MTQPAITKTLCPTASHQIKNRIALAEHFTEFIIIGFMPALYSYFKSLNNEANENLLYDDLLQDK